MAIIKKVKSFQDGYDKHKNQVIKVINKLSQEYDKSIPIIHLKAELRKLRAMRLSKKDLIQ